VRIERKPIAELPFSDGVVRAVFEGAVGGQYVVDDDGVAIRGIWVRPDEATVVDGGQLPTSEKAG
jgi:hypothetical protein